MGATFVLAYPFYSGVSWGCGTIMQQCDQTDMNVRVFFSIAMLVPSVV